MTGETIWRFQYDEVIVSVSITDARFESVLTNLRADFAAFPERTEPDSDSREIEIKISGDDPRALALGWGRTRMTPSYRFFPRVCDHGGGTTSSIERPGLKTRISIDGRDAAHVYEIAYVGLISVLGWELEKSGYVRLHALGLRFSERASIFHLAPKGGKSTLAVEAAKAGIEVLGDEIVLIKGKRAHAFPLRGAVHDHVAREMNLDVSRTFSRKTFDSKSLVELAPVTGGPVEIDSIVFQAESGLARETARASFFDFLKWSTWTCFGIGLPQMREFALRAEELIWIPVIFARRAAFTWNFWRTGGLRVSRRIEIAEAVLHSRLGWARSSSARSEGAFETHPAQLPLDTARGE